MENERQTKGETLMPKQFWMMRRREYFVCYKLANPRMAVRGSSRGGVER